MSPTAPSTDRRRIVPALLVLALAAATIALGLTGALFTDSDSITGNNFATGTVTLSAGTTTDLPFNVEPMAPGDTEGPYDVTVSNDGSMEHRYAITSTATSNADNLAEEVDLSIWNEADEASSGDGCDETPNEDASLLYGPDSLATGESSAINLVGDPAAGSHTDDRVLDSSTSEVLCFYVELPSTTDSTFEGTSATVDFGFEAEQTANNS